MTIKISELLYKVIFLLKLYWKDSSRFFTHHELVNVLAQVLAQKFPRISCFAETRWKAVAMIKLCLVTKQLHASPFQSHILECSAINCDKQKHFQTKWNPMQQSKSFIKTWVIRQLVLAFSINVKRAIEMSLLGQQLTSCPANFRFCSCFVVHFKFYWFMCYTNFNWTQIKLSNATSLWSLCNFAGNVTKFSETQRPSM